LPKYFINLDQDVINFIDFKVEPLRNISAEPNYHLELGLSLRRSVSIWDQPDGNPIEIGTTSDLALLEVTCEITFLLQESQKSKRVLLRPFDDSRLYISGNSFFYYPMQSQDIEKLNSWRNGETILLQWNLRGFAAVADSNSIPIIWLNGSNITQNLNHRPSMDSNRFYSKIMAPVGLSHTFFEDFPIEIPQSIVTASSLPIGISGLIHELQNLVEHLRSAVTLLRESRRIEDFRHVMDEVKSSMDSIRNYPNKQSLAKEILVNTGIIGNVDGSGSGDRSAEQYIDYYFKILENIYQMASKPAHTKLRGQTIPARFSMTPDRSDAVFVLTMALAASKFLIERINLYINTVR
jgi:hypothetical protein